MSVGPAMCVASVIQCPSMIDTANIEECVSYLEERHAIVTVVMRVREVPVAASPCLVAVVVVHVVCMINDWSHPDRAACSENLVLTRVAAERHTVQLLVFESEGVADAVCVAIPVIGGAPAVRASSVLQGA